MSNFFLHKKLITFSATKTKAEKLLSIFFYLNFNNNISSYFKIMKVLLCHFLNNKTMKEKICIQKTAFIKCKTPEKKMHILIPTNIFEKNLYYKKHAI